MQIHFVHRSSSNCFWFVWPKLPNDVLDISWVSEGEGNTSYSDIHSKLPLNIQYRTLYFILNGNMLHSLL